MSGALEIKICGVTSVTDALAAVDAGADAIGLNFYPPSRRSLQTSLAEEIAAAVGARAMKVGVFVNHPAVLTRERFRACRLDAAQIHGDEPPEYLAELVESGLPASAIIRAFRPPGSLGPVEQYLDACAALGCLPGAVLIDAASPAHYGGSGQVADWRAIAARSGALTRLPLILAGGLTPENVGEAIRVARPAGVDVASGVEEPSGRKSPERMRAFVAAAHGALRERS